MRPPTHHALLHIQSTTKAFARNNLQKRLVPGSLCHLFSARRPIVPAGGLPANLIIVVALIDHTDVRRPNRSTQPIKVRLYIIRHSYPNDG
jgi:hypothetical protein